MISTILEIGNHLEVVAIIAIVFMLLCFYKYVERKYK